MNAAKKTHIIKNGEKIHYDGIPDGAYAAMGGNGAEAGSLFMMVFDNGTCLKPVFGEDGKQVKVDSRAAGKVYKKERRVWVGS